MFSDMPKSLQIYNCWRNRVVSAWLQSNGINVIPVIEWSDKSSLLWCLDGLPKNSTLAVQTNGSFLNAATKMNFVKGMEDIYKELTPSDLVVYGRGSEYLNYFHNVHFFDSYCQGMKKRL